MSQTGFDTIVVGGGVIGLFTAWELSKQGQSVCVLERGVCGQEASWAAAGILSPLRPWKYPDSVNQLALESQALYPALCDELQAESGIDCERQASGMLILDCPEQDRVMAWAVRYQQPVEWLDASTLSRQFPGVVQRNPELTACFLPQVARLRNPRMLKALRATLLKRNVEVREHSEVKGLSIEGDRVVGVCLDSSVLHADNVVLAAGAWASELLRDVDEQLQITPVRGQMLLFAAGVTLPGSILMQGDRYLVPRADGRILAGSSAEYVGFNKHTDDEVLASIRADAVSMWPALGEARVEAQWAGLRPATQGEEPVIGPHSRLKGLYMNSGHFRSGIVMAPASARKLAERMAVGLEASEEN